uniref:Peptidase S1 domain-containing protein n=1 Tax=Anopheles atroparvus TaxID=41427 RepID=A0A182JGP6_ANOAO
MGYSKVIGITLYSVAVLQSAAIGNFIETPAIGSVRYGGKHRCNAIGVASDVAIVPAGCIRQSDPIQSYSALLPSTPDRSTTIHPVIDSQRRCQVKRFLPHPSHHFLSNNIGLIQVGCGNRGVSGEPNFAVRDVTGHERLTLVGLAPASSRRQLVTPVHVQDCAVCLEEYGAFDCMRQLCLQLVGKYRSKLNNLDGLAGAGVLALDGSIVGLLSYGFANSSLVAERVKFYELFVREMVSSLREL